MFQAPSPAPTSFWQNGARSIAALRGQVPRATRQYALVAFFSFEVFCLTFLQKIAFPLYLSVLGLGNLGSVEAVIPLTYFAMVALFVVAPPRIDLNRLFLFIFFVLMSLISISLVRNSFSTLSIILTLICYGPFILYIEVSRSTYKKMVAVFLNAMILFGAIVLIQQAMQLIWTWRIWPNLDKILPVNWQFTGYVYIQPLYYGSKFMKPNGIFFLEVSYVSQWTALAIALELAFFRRILRLIFYSIVMIGCFAGTGLLLLALCAPVLLTRLNWKSLLGVALVFAVGFLFAVQINWYGNVHQRFGEYEKTRSSSNLRFIEPLDVLVSSVGRHNAIFTGEGPGNIPKGESQIWWSSTKLVYEYGLFTAASFMLFFAYALFYKAPSQRVALLLFLMFNFMSGFNIPVYPLLMFVVGGLFRIADEKTSGGSADKPRRRKAMPSASLNSPWRKPPDAPPPDVGSRDAMSVSR